MTPVLKSSPALLDMPVSRRATFDDYEGIAALERACGLSTRPRDQWERLWTANPVYRALAPDWPIGWVLECPRTGELAGTLSNVPLSYVFRGRNLLAATGRGWAVDPRFRAFAPLLFEEYFDQAADLLLSTTVNDQAAASHQSRDQTRVPVGDWESAAYMITGYRGFARAALSIQRLPAPHLLCHAAAPVLWLKDRLSASRMPAAPNGMIVLRRTTFDERFDRFWQELRERKQSKLLAVRTREVLDWRFGPALAAGRDALFTIENGSRLLAYAVLHRKDHAESGLTRMRLADFQAVEDPDNAFAAILRQAVDFCHDNGIDALERTGCGLPGTIAFDAAAPHRRKLPAWCFYVDAPDPVLRREIDDPDVWEPSSYDGDGCL